MKKMLLVRTNGRVICISDNLTNDGLIELLNRLFQMEKSILYLDNCDFNIHTYLFLFLQMYYMKKDSFHIHSKSCEKRFRYIYQHQLRRNSDEMCMKYGSLQKEVFLMKTLLNLRIKPILIL